MKVKRYVAVSVNEAVEKIRKELGTNAIILDTKKVKKGGIFGLFSEIRYEVIAAVDDPLPDKERNSIAYRDEIGKREPDFEELFKRDFDLLTKQVRTGSDPKVKGEGNDLIRSSSSNGDRLRRNEGRAEKRVGIEEEQDQDGRTETKERGERTKQSAVNGKTEQKEKKEPSTTYRSKRGGRNAAVGDDNDPWQKQVLAEMKEMRGLIRAWVLKKSDPQALPEMYRPFFHHLIQQGVEEEIVMHLFTDLMENPQPIDSAEAGQRMKTKLSEWIAPHMSGGIDPKTRLVQILGPTGVGKTTTIAKLASEYTLKRKKRVAFLTADTYRIAAIDQLKTYANILNIPMEVVFSPQDISQSLKRLSHYDLIFMDTAGRNYRDQKYLEEMKHLLTHSIPTQTYLVLSLTGKEKDSKELVEEFLNLGIKDMILTKFDETSTYGTLLNLIYHYPITLSYITNGQSVPDDLFHLSTDRLIDLLMEGGK